jgi:ABC-type uncharacterized transport system auxiliary subunit
MRLIRILLLATCVAACAAPGPREPDRYFLLAAAAAPDGRPRQGPPIAVAPTSASGFYDTQEIAYSRAPGTRAYYRFNFWTERPQRSVQAQLAARLESPGTKPALRLRTHLDEIYHDAAEPPGVARIAITADVLDPATGAVLARRTFTRSAPAASYDAPGAVRGFNEALAALIRDIEGWVDAEALPKSPR